MNYYFKDIIDRIEKDKQLIKQAERLLEDTHDYGTERDIHMAIGRLEMSIEFARMTLEEFINENNSV